ncbi:N-acetylmuramoyl-L-alanine amidase [Acetohalobium arabaticum]|uniref:Cell wall hydrolase/autolysin n=1 Tax=Acetohalobium arabaticum (strain ATCC 49924 / DSM 5501 / Z-7288) TaxID=574087 RepID=D9QRF2_ACEAZ|nr:N-acetylmuramoyl-L-alanine amidase [Acetohalobium arabaticum]ADL13093.1 cell wall hydrolase/autolysin [Acetohalobium arabaticum DSM 5501]
MINFWIISKYKFIIILSMIIFLVSFFAGGITKHNNFSQLEKIVVIDPGHGSIDKGTHRNEVYEKEINLKIAKELAALLEKGNLQVILTRTDDSLYKDDRNKDIKYRARLANKKDADLFVSIHVNSFPGTSSFGGQTFYTPNSPQSKKLAKFIQQELINIQPENYRKIKPGNFYVLNKTDMPAVLAEVGFLSNDVDFKRLTSTEERKKIAKALSKGIITYFNSNLPLPPTEKEAQQTVQTNTSLNNKFKVYFPKVTATEADLIPINQTVPTTEIFVTNSNSLIEQIASKALEALIAGPELKDKFQNIIPVETEVLELKVKNKTAYVNFSREIMTNFNGGSTKEALAVNAIVQTLTQFSEINEVEILIEGQQNKSIGGHIFFEYPLTKKDLPIIR